MAYYPTQTDIRALSFPEKILYVKVLLLNQQFQTVYQMQHEYVSGESSTNVDSDIRNTFNMTLHVRNNNVGIAEDKLLWIDKFVKVYIGVQVPFHPDILWYDKGIFVLTDYSFNKQTNLLQISCSDLVCMLNGDVGGSLIPLEVVIEEDQKWTIREAMIHVLTKHSPFTKYNIIDMPKLIPYDLEFSATDTVWTMLTKLRDLYKSGCEMYFDTDGTFVCKEISAKASDPVVLDDSILQRLYTSESDNGVLKDIRNVSKVWGKCLETDYFTETCEYDVTTNTYSAHFEDIALNEDGSLPTSTKFAFKVPSVNTKDAPKIAVYNKPKDSETETLVGTFDITDSLEEKVKTNFFIKDASFVLRYRRAGMYAMGQWQIVATNILRCTEPTKEQIDTDMETYACDNVTYTIIPNSPFGVEKIGYRFRSYASGEYDDIQAIDDCITRAEYETWKSAKVGSTMSLNMVYIPWLQGNEKVEFRLSESGELKQWIVKSITSSHPHSTMTLTLEEFQEKYNFDINDIN